MSLSGIYIFTILMVLTHTQGCRWSSSQAVFILCRKTTPCTKFSLKILWGNTMSLSAELRARICGSQIPERKVHPNWKFYPFLKHILSLFHFTWLLGCALSVDYQMIGLKYRYMDIMRIYYKKKGDGFQVDSLCFRGYTYNFSGVIKFCQNIKHWWEFHLCMLV